jgi:hypothetical protein
MAGQWNIIDAIAEDDVFSTEQIVRAVHRGTTASSSVAL